MDIKQKMMSLWKETFHDSDEYINLLFDKYYDPDLVEYEVRGNDLIASLMGIPYEFGGVDNRIRGLYLCGLATKQKFRGEGVMSSLLKKINLKALERGFAFTFLIPASNRLAAFYARRGYVDAFYRCQANYTSLHDFSLEFSTILEEQKGHVAELKKRYYDSLVGGFLTQENVKSLSEQIIDLMQMCEQEQNDMEIIHSRSDMDTIIKENQISGGKIYYVSSAQGQISAVAFTSLIDRSRVDVYRMFSADQASSFRLLDFIKHQEPDAGIRLFLNPRVAERKNLAQMFGMAHILNLSEILKFQATAHGDLKYSILVKGDKPGMVDRFDVNGGNVKVKSLSTNDDDFDSNRTVMSLRDMSSVLFRRPDSGVLITEAFGMPSLGGYIYLMLD